MGDKTSKPWSFGLAGGKGGGKAIICFVVVIVVAILVHIGGYVSAEMKDRRLRPEIALKSILRDVRAFSADNKRLPANFREIDANIWRGKNGSLQYGENIYVNDNYEYFYFSGMIGAVAQVHIWAVPTGKYRDSAETVLMIVTPKGEDVWSGPALSDAHRDYVRTNGFNPDLATMAKLSMTKSGAAPPAPASKKPFGIF